MRSLLGLLVVVPLLVAAPADAAEPTCRGQAATIVGTQVGEVVGTEGDDVIVTAGAERVDALGGDDVVCVTGDYWDQTVFAGDGDDIVDTTGSSYSAATWLAGGADTFVGGTVGDFVVDDGYYPSGNASADVITTGAGDDHVVVGRFGPHADVVHLGAGADTIDVPGSVDPAADLRGGAGTDKMFFATAPEVRTPVRVDNRQGTATQGGVPLLSWQSVEQFVLTAVDTTRFTFRGADRAESVSIGYRRRLVVDIAMGGGADEVGITHRVIGQVSGGTDVDTLRLIGHLDHRVEADLAKRAVRVYGPSGARRTTRLQGLEQLDATTWWDATLVGDGGPNVLSATETCRTTLRGGGGHDLLRRTDDTRCDSGQTPASTMVGGAGPDRFLGSELGDLLVGGPGQDRADGRGGADICRVEVRRHCERQ